MCPTCMAPRRVRFTSDSTPPGLSGPYRRPAHGPPLPRGDECPPIALLEMPADIFGDLARVPAIAAKWRLSLREHFEWALHHGYSAHGVHRNATGGRCFSFLVGG